jgi:hypothetical protein
MNELTIAKLLSDEISPTLLRKEIIEIGRNRQWRAFLHKHHIEPERVEIINLTPLEHLAIHICFAKLYPSGSANAKVSCFVKHYPNSHTNNSLIEISPQLKADVLSFGQSRPDSSPRTLAHARSFIDREKQSVWMSELGKRQKGRMCKWADKVSATMLATPVCCCIICHKEMKAITGNITQHQRSSKCKPHDHKK